MKYYALIIFFILSGCSTMDAYVSQAKHQGAETADRVVADGHYLYCDAATGGAMVRECGMDSACWTNRVRFCTGSDKPLIELCQEILKETTCE